MTESDRDFEHAERLATQPAIVELGLTSTEVEERERAGLANVDVKPPSKTVGQIIASNLFTYFNLIFLILAILLVVVRSYRDLTFLPIIIANTLIGILQELRAKKVLDELTMISTPRTLTLRDGKEVEVPVNQLVKDDVVIFRAGNQIPADCLILSGKVTVNESLLTGEADEVHKDTGENLMSGTFIVSGECRARLQKVGKESYISKLTLEAKATKTGEQSEIIRSLNKIVKTVGVIIIPIGIILFCQQYFLEGVDAQRSVQAMVAAVIGMIPEGLFLLASVTLVISAMKLAHNKVLLHDMKSIETLARVDTLCVDKTGTITDGTMQVIDLELINPDMEMTAVRDLLSDFAAAQNSDNITMQAIKDYFTQPTGRKAISVAGFSSEFKYSGVEFAQESVVLGAPEFVLKDQLDQYRAKIARQSEQGYRVLVFGRYDGVPDGQALTKPIVPYCLIVLSNPIRANAPDTFQYFYRQGVDIKVISGDNPLTVSQIAKQAKIRNADRYIDCTTLQDDQAIESAVSEYTVFGRVTPEQKRKMVRALKKQGHTVAMTGDGVNDVLALKDADCSIAMASGSEAAVQTSQLVLLESDFSKMPDIVHEGRRVVNNLERSGSLFLVKNTFSMLTAILAIIFSITYPLTPAQVSLISMFTIGVPAFLLSQIPNTDLIRGNFAKNIITRALPGGITDTIIVAMLVVAGTVFDISTPEISTIATILLSIVGLIVIYGLSRPLDHYKMLIWVGCIIGLVFSLLFLRPLFGLVDTMSTRAAFLCVIFAFMTVPVLRFVSKILKFIHKLLLEKIDQPNSPAKA